MIDISENAHEMSYKGDYLLLKIIHKKYWLGSEDWISLGCDRVPKMGSEDPIL